jgi:hypothetical protein
MAEGHGGALGRLDQVAARAVRRLRSSAPWLGAAAAALAVTLAMASLLLADCTAAAAATSQATTTRSAAAMAMRPTTATTTSPEAITGALVAPDGRLIVVTYTGGGCVVGAKLTATETRSTVTLVLRQVLSGASICPADLIEGLTVTVTLPHPLWGRSLIDGSTGRRIPYFDGRKLLRVTYLPPGYRFSAYMPFPSTSSVAWEREFTSPGRATAPVDIEQLPGNVAVGPAWPASGRVSVRGHLAALEVGASGGLVFGLAITWRAGGYSFVVYTVQVRAGQRLLSIAQLTGIANGLRS